MVFGTGYYRRRTTWWKDGTSDRSGTRSSIAMRMRIIKPADEDDRSDSSVAFIILYTETIGLGGQVWAQWFS